MTERELMDLWIRARLHIILAQLAPTFLLIVAVALIALGLNQAEPLVRWATIGILLASGILGALAQYAAATEAIAVSVDLKELNSEHALARQAVRFAPWMNVVRFVTPAIFLGIFALLVAELL